MTGSQPSQISHYVIVLLINFKAFKSRSVDGGWLWWSAINHIYPTLSSFTLVHLTLTHSQYKFHWYPDPSYSHLCNLSSHSGAGGMSGTLKTSVCDKCPNG